MKWPLVAEALRSGKPVEVHPKGNSMTPIIKSGQRIVITPTDQKNVKVGDVVLAKVKGHYYVHKVTAIQGGMCQISNNHGHINGWTSQVFGRVTEIG